MNSNFFVGIGAAKSGTSWLADYLYAHPEVAMSPIKELHYFDARFCAELCGHWNEKWLEIWIAMCVYLLIAFLKFQSALTKSMPQLLRLLPLNLFDKRELMALLRGDPPDGRLLIPIK